MASYNIVNDVRTVGSFFNVMQGIMSLLGGIAMLYMAYSSYKQKDVKTQVFDAKVKEVTCVSRIRSRRSSSSVRCSLLVEFKKSGGELIQTVVETSGYGTYVKNQNVTIETSASSPNSYDICCTNHSQNIYIYGAFAILCLAYSYYHFYYYNSLALGVYNMASSIFD